MGLVNQHVDNDLAAYAERRLSAARTAQVDAHLAVCRACRAAASETAALVDALQATPAALRGWGRASGPPWPQVWARVAAPIRPALPRRLPRLSFYVSLVAVAFSAATLLPGTLGGPPAVTAGVVETPVVVSLTPRADLAPGLNATAAVALNLAATPAGPLPAPTPQTGP